MVKPGAAHCREQADHGGHDSAFLDEANLLVEDRGGIAVETDDEPAMHLEPGPLDTLHRGHQVAIPVRRLAALQMATLIGGFNTDKYLFETGPDHKFHEAGIVREIDRRFGGEVERILFSLHPFDYCRKNLSFQFTFVADEVVINKKDCPAPSTVIQAVQLGNQLPGRLAPRSSPEQHGYVTELAVIGTAPAVLNIHGRVIPQVNQSP